MTSSIPTRRLGKDGPEVTALGYGSMGLSAFYGPAKPDNERLALLDQIYDLGERFWDSSDVYGDSEDLLGKWFAANPEKRAHVFLATKFGVVADANGLRGIDSSGAYAAAACDRSLARLGLSSIDLYYCHRMDGRTPIEQTVRAMAALQAQGKVKHLGLSECSATTLRRASRVATIAAVQLEYSPWSLEIESEQTDLLRTARELGVAVVAYSPIGRGMLSGEIRSPADFQEGDFRKFNPRFREENFAKNLALVDKLKGMAEKKGCTSSQLCLAWLMAQGDDIIPIPGTTRIERVKENLGSLHVKLSKEEEQEIRKACEEAEIHGERYPEQMMAYLFADTPEE